jgi:hypothetical protein
MTNTITIASDYYNSGDLFIAVVSYYDKFAVAYKDTDGSYIAADKSVVDDYVHHQWLCSGHYAQVDDLCWQEFCIGKWVLGHRDEVRRYIKEHQIKEDKMEKYWNGVESVIKDSDKIFLEYRTNKADFNTVVNTLYTYCVDATSTDIADSDSGFSTWCRRNDSIVRSVVERFEEPATSGCAKCSSCSCKQEAEEEEETKLSEHDGCSRLVSSRTNATIELEPGVTLNTQYDLDLDEDSSYKIAAWMSAESFRTLCSMHDPTGALAVLDIQIRRAYEQLFDIHIRQSCKDVHINDTTGQLWFKYTTPADQSRYCINVDNKITFN